MGVDLRQVVAGILTVTMFVMLGNMIKRDHFDSPQGSFPGGARDTEFNVGKVTEKGLAAYGKNSDGPWIANSDELKPCWSKSSFDGVEESKGFITFSLTSGPEYHVSQVADAVVVARYLGATLVVPDIRGTKPGDQRKFAEIYDVDGFVKSLEGVVKVVEELPNDVSVRNIAVAKVPNRVTEDHIADQVEPLFRKKGNIRLATYFASANMRKSTQKSNSDSVECLAMFRTLQLQQELGEVVDSMIERLRVLSRVSGSRFVAVDLRVEMLENKGCDSGSTGTKSCYNAQEIAIFLRKLGFDKDTTIYLTQSRWVDDLDVLKDIFPRTYTKESIMPAGKQSTFLETENSEFEKAIDFYICTRSDVFVPAISGLFYANVVGQRIATGKTEVLVPSSISGTSALVTNHFSPYISKKNHMAYSCFC